MNENYYNNHGIELKYYEMKLHDASKYNVKDIGDAITRPPSATTIFCNRKTVKIKCKTFFYESEVRNKR